MENKIRQLGLALALGATLLFASTSNADTIIIDIEEVDQTVGGFLGYPSFSVTHTLEGFTLGSALSGVLSIEMRDDDRDCRWDWCSGEVTSVIIGLIDFQDGSILWDPNSTFVSSLGVNSIAGLNSTGMLTWTLLPTGDFWVGNATLEVVTVAVPEPGTLGLLGFGLMLLGIRSQRRKS